MDCRINSWIPGIGYTYVGYAGETYDRDFLYGLELEMTLNRFSVFFFLGLHYCGICKILLITFEWG